MISINEYLSSKLPARFSGRFPPPHCYLVLTRVHPETLVSGWKPIVCR